MIKYKLKNCKANENKESRSIKKIRFYKDEITEVEDNISLFPFEKLIVEVDKIIKKSKSKKKTKSKN